MFTKNSRKRNQNQKSFSALLNKTKKNIFSSIFKKKKKERKECYNEKHTKISKFY